MGKIFEKFVNVFKNKRISTLLFVSVFILSTLGVGLTAVLLSLDDKDQSTGSNEMVYDETWADYAQEVASHCDVNTVLSPLLYQGYGQNQYAYHIYDSTQLSLLLYVVFANNMSENYGSYICPSICLEADIDLSGRAWIPATVYGDGTTMLYGNGFSINNMCIDENCNASYYGFFYMTVDYAIQDVTFKNAYVYCNEYSQGSGIVVGYASISKMISNKFVNESFDYYGYYNNVKIESGYINGSGNACGGLFGVVLCGYDFSGTIMNACGCKADININGNVKYMGGLIGILQTTFGTIENCYFSGHIYYDYWGEAGDSYGGGLVGVAYFPSGDSIATIDYTACYFYSNSIWVSDAVNFGGFTGYGRGAFNNCFSVVDDERYILSIYAFLGKIDSSSGIYYNECYCYGYPSEMFDPSQKGTSINLEEITLNEYNTETGDVRWPSWYGGVWSFMGDLPEIVYLRDTWEAGEQDWHSLSSLSGSGTQNDPYLVGSTADLFAVSLSASSDSLTGKYFRLTNDINLYGYVWTPIGTSSYPFQGFFDGGGHTINGLTISSDCLNSWMYEGYAFGLFGYIENAVIQNLKFTNVIINFGNGNDELYLGTVAGASDMSRIFNCHVLSGSLYVSTPSGYSNQYTYYGGLVGSSNGVLAACSCEMQICTQIFSNGSYIYGGGLCGTASGNISDCYFKCYNDMDDIVAGDVKRTIATEKRVSFVNHSGDNAYFGFLVGYVSEYTPITNCYSYTNHAKIVTNGAGRCAGFVAYSDSKIDMYSCIAKNLNVQAASEDYNLYFGELSDTRTRSSGSYILVVTNGDNGFNENNFGFNECYIANLTYVNDATKLASIYYPHGAACSELYPWDFNLTWFLPYYDSSESQNCDLPVLRNMESPTFFFDYNSDVGSDLSSKWSMSDPWETFELDEVVDRWNPNDILYLYGPSAMGDAYLNGTMNVGPTSAWGSGLTYQIWSDYELYDDSLALIIESYCINRNIPEIYDATHSYDVYLSDSNTLDFSLEFRYYPNVDYFNIYLKFSEGLRFGFYYSPQNMLADTTYLLKFSLNYYQNIINYDCLKYTIFLSDISITNSNGETESFENVFQTSNQGTFFDMLYGMNYGSGIGMDYKDMYEQPIRWYRQKNYLDKEALSNSGISVSSYYFGNTIETSGSIPFDDLERGLYKLSYDQMIMLGEYDELPSFLPLFYTDLPATEMLVDTSSSNENDYSQFSNVTMVFSASVPFSIRINSNVSYLRFYFRNLSLERVDKPDLANESDADYMDFIDFGGNKTGKVYANLVDSQQYKTISFIVSGYWVDAPDEISINVDGTVKTVGEQNSVNFLIPASTRTFNYRLSTTSSSNKNYYISTSFTATTSTDKNVSVNYTGNTYSTTQIIFYIRQELTITFAQGAGESGTLPNSIVFAYGQSVTLPTNPFTRNGFSSNGWNTTGSGTGTSYASGARITVYRNLTLYPNFTPIYSTVYVHIVTLSMQDTPITSEVGGSVRATRRYSSSFRVYSSTQTFTTASGNYQTIATYVSTITATPADGYIFCGFSSGNLRPELTSEPENTYEITPEHGEMYDVFVFFKKKSNNQLKWTSEEGGYWYFEDGEYPQSEVTDSDTLGKLATINRGTSGDYSLQYQNGEDVISVPVYTLDSNKYAYVTVNNVSKWFKVEPIRWRVSDYGVSEANCPLQNYGASLTGVVVSDKILFASAMTPDEIDDSDNTSSGDFWLNEYVQNENNLQLALNLQYDGSFSHSQDSFVIAGSQQVVASGTSSSNVAVYSNSDSTLSNSRAKLTAFASFLMYGTTEYANSYDSYWSRELQTGEQNSLYGSGVVVTNYGKETLQWLNTVCGVRLSYYCAECSRY